VGGRLRSGGSAQLGGSAAELGYLARSGGTAWSLATDLAARDSIELGCGTGYVSAWLARRGARPVGLDNSAAQLATARALQDRFGLPFPLIHASAEQPPCADASFDLAISEYGASIWCDPYAWIPEAARMLRPGGQLIFLVNAVQVVLTWPDQDDLPATDRLQRPYFGMHRFHWVGSDSVEFHIGHGDMIRLLRWCPARIAGDGVRPRTRGDGNAAAPGRQFGHGRAPDARSDVRAAAPAPGRANRPQASAPSQALPAPRPVSPAQEANKTQTAWLAPARQARLNAARRAGPH
jgi:SAM-dependent methyltransferase